MTRRDEVIRMARSTGWDLGWEMTVEQVCEFAALVAAAERERCAALIKKLSLADLPYEHPSDSEMMQFVCGECWSREIRALKDEVSE